LSYNKQVDDMACDY